MFPDASGVRGWFETLRDICEPASALAWGDFPDCAGEACDTCVVKRKRHLRRRPLLGGGGKGDARWRSRRAPPRLYTNLAVRDRRRRKVTSPTAAGQVNS